MPGFNGTGPMGAGPMTGGARGYCTSDGTGFQSGYGRQGFGRGRGRGYCRGFRRRGENQQSPFSPERMNPADELGVLKAQATEMKATLDRIEKRMSELNPEPET